MRKTMKSGTGPDMGLAAVALLGVGLIGGTATAATNYVWSGGSHTAPYDTWATAATNIQDAVDYACTNYPAYDTVLVTNGTYNITNQIGITNGITVSGVNGAMATIVARTSGTARVFFINHAAAIVDGFTVTNGLIDNNGGGILISNGTVRNCRILGNTVTGGTAYRGAGVYLAAGLLSGSLVQGNTGNANGWAGGVYVVGGTVSNCVITGNSIANYGYAGGVWMAGAGLLVNCVVSSNVLAVNGRGGGGVYCSGGGTVRNCLIFANRTTDTVTSGAGGGVKCVSGGRIENCTIVGNTSSREGGGIWCDSAAAQIQNSIVYYNTAGGNENWQGGSWTNCCATPAPSGQGNTSIEPELISRVAGDFRLLPGSPCINGGTNLAWMAGAADLDGNARILDGTNDMGCYEYKTGALQCNFTGSPLRKLAPVSVAFAAMAAGTNTSSLYYQWDFDNNGSTDQEGGDKQTVTNSYAAGLHTAKLTVSNGVGEIAVYSKTNYIIAAPPVVYVTTNGGALAPYASWATASTTIQAAVNMGADGSLVLVSNGTYSLSGQINVDDGVTVRSVNGAANTTVRRVSDEFRIFWLSHSNAVLDGFTIFNGRSAWRGGGVFCSAGTVQNCTIVSNSAAGQAINDGGGGVALTGGLVRNCLIVRNTADQNGAGGGVWMSGGVVTDCTIATNVAPSYGYAGGVMLQGGGSLINCVVCSNSLPSQGRGGGGVYINNAGTVRNSLIFRNITSDTAGSGDGGGVKCVSGGAVQSCTIVSNEATAGDGGGVWCNNATPRLENSIVYFNISTSAVSMNYTNGAIAFTCATPLAPGVSNISSDPQFRDAAAFNFRLAESSPCVNTGSNDTWMVTAIDLDGQQRIAQSKVDRGAYEIKARGTLFVIH